MEWVISSALVVALIFLAADAFNTRQKLSAALRGLSEKDNQLKERATQLQAKEVEATGLCAENATLQPFASIRDAAAEVSRLQEEAVAIRRNARAEADEIIRKAEGKSDELRRDAWAANAEVKAKGERLLAAAKQRAETLVTDANKQSERLLADAAKRAEEIAGDAYRALKDADGLKAATVAMKNVVMGYGDRYLVPTASLLDELDEAYGFDEAGRALTAAREKTRLLVTSGRAAECSYAESTRRDTAIRFVLDAFNGKVDTILGKVKTDNAGTLEQQIRDGYSLVNLNGKAFRDARITVDYLEARVDELRWAAAVQALREREKEEQRRIREQIREEEKARREIERALRDAAKEEDQLQRAMEKVQQQVARANDEQRAVFEAKLAELQVKLGEAEARNQRALSMAQQTKAGHVYVISNVGSFGDRVLKVGMTRRLEPQDRIRELGDASVPFEFDVHAMIWTDDAPTLEKVLHRKFVHQQINKVNPRKEFFRVGVDELKATVEALGLEASWTLTATAAQYRETLAIERALAEGAPMAETWLNEQLAFDPGVPADALETEEAAS